MGRKSGSLRGVQIPPSKVDENLCPDAQSLGFIPGSRASSGARYRHDIPIVTSCNSCTRGAAPQAVMQDYGECTQSRLRVNKYSAFWAVNNNRYQMLYC